MNITKAQINTSLKTAGLRTVSMLNGMYNPPKAYLGSGKRQRGIVLCSYSPMDCFSKDEQKGKVREKIRDALRGIGMIEVTGQPMTYVVKETSKTQEILEFITVNVPTSVGNRDYTTDWLVPIYTKVKKTS